MKDYIDLKGTGEYVAENFGYEELITDMFLIDLPDDETFNVHLWHKLDEE